MSTFTTRNRDAAIETHLSVSAGLGSRIHQRYIDIFGTEGINGNEALALAARHELARGADFTAKPDGKSGSFS